MILADRVRDRCRRCPCFERSIEYQENLPRPRLGAVPTHGHPNLNRIHPIHISLDFFGKRRALATVRRGHDAGRHWFQLARSPMAVAAPSVPAGRGSEALEFRERSVN
jgi:hypothetical protein